MSHLNVHIVQNEYGFIIYQIAHIKNTINSQQLYEIMKTLTEPSHIYVTFEPINWNYCKLLMSCQLNYLNLRRSSLKKSAPISGIFYMLFNTIFRPRVHHRPPGKICWWYLCTLILIHKSSKTLPSCLYASCHLVTIWYLHHWPL